jgi:RNA methyltransferase, TrmH family
MLGKNQIKEIQSLHLRKFRDSKKLFICEGTKTVDELLTGRPEWVREIYALPEFIQPRISVLREHAIKFVEVSPGELKKISLQATPNAVQAVCAQPQESAGEIDFQNEFSIYLDDIRDPGNLGTIMRVCDWFGIKTIYCSPESCEQYNPKVIQSTMGAFLRVSVVYIQLADLIRRHNIANVYGGLLNGKDLYSESLANGLIVIGNEANGIREENLPLITGAITIPSAGKTGSESLNAAMATSIIAAEFFRQLKLL